MNQGPPHHGNQPPYYGNQPPYYGNQPPPPKKDNSIRNLFIIFGVVGGFALIGALGGRHNSQRDTSVSSESKQSSILARAEVKCLGLGTVTTCSVAMSGGKGRVCWDSVAVCDGLERVLNDCSDVLDPGSTASYTRQGSQFTPPITADMTCSSFRVANMKMK